MERIRSKVGGASFSPSGFRSLYYVLKMQNFNRRVKEEVTELSLFLGDPLVFRLWRRVPRRVTYLGTGRGGGTL